MTDEVRYYRSVPDQVRIPAHLRPRAAAELVDMAHDRRLRWRYHDRLHNRWASDCRFVLDFDVLADQDDLMGNDFIVDVHRMYRPVWRELLTRLGLPDEVAKLDGPVRVRPAPTGETSGLTPPFPADWQVLDEPTG